MTTTFAAGHRAVTAHHHHCASVRSASVMGMGMGMGMVLRDVLRGSQYPQTSVAAHHAGGQCHGVRCGLGQFPQTFDLK
jgi:hypothetical protein